MLEVGSI